VESGPTRPGGSPKWRIEWVKYLNSLQPEVPDEIGNLFDEPDLNGGLEKTRTSDLFRVNLAKAILLLLFPPK